VTAQRNAREEKTALNKPGEPLAEIAQGMGVSPTAVLKGADWHPFAIAYSEKGGVE